MIGNIRNFSINDIFWCTLKPGVFIFRYKELPEHIHFTFVFDEKQDYMEFHITKNVGDDKNKPKIKVVQVNSKLLLSKFPSFIPELYRRVFLPFDIKDFVGAENELAFISYNDIENSELGAVTEKQLIRAFKNNSKVKQKTRLKVKGNLNECASKFSKSDDLIDALYKAMEPVDDNYKTEFDSGILVNNTGSMQALRIGSQWYTMATDLSIFKILCLFVDRKTAYHIISRTIFALEKIVPASSSTDTALYNKPIELIFSETNEIFF